MANNGFSLPREKKGSAGEPLTADPLYASKLCKQAGISEVKKHDSAEQAPSDPALIPFPTPFPFSGFISLTFDFTLTFPTFFFFLFFFCSTEAGAQLLNKRCHT